MQTPKKNRNKKLRSRVKAAPQSVFALVIVTYVTLVFFSLAIYVASGKAQVYDIKQYQSSYSKNDSFSVARTKIH